MGVGAEMPMRVRAARLAVLKAIPGNADEASGASAMARPLVGRGSESRARAAADEPWRRAVKHGGQYTGRSGRGRKGTVVDVSQSAQTAG